MSLCNICDRLVFENDVKSVEGIIFHKDCFRMVYSMNAMCMWCYRLILPHEKCVYTLFKGKPVNYHAWCILQHHRKNDECTFCVVSGNLCPQAAIVLKLDKTKKRDQPDKIKTTEFKDEKTESDVDMTDVTSVELNETDSDLKHKKRKKQENNDPLPISGIETTIKPFQAQFFKATKEMVNAYWMNSTNVDEGIKRQTVALRDKIVEDEEEKEITSSTASRLDELREHLFHVWIPHYFDALIMCFDQPESESTKHWQNEQKHIAFAVSLILRLINDLKNLNRRYFEDLLKNCPILEKFILEYEEAVLNQYFS